MSRFHSHIATAASIIQNYDGVQPLAQWLKAFFAADKKYGSTDRKTITSLCYYYYRTGHAWRNKTVREKILSGLFICENESDILALMWPELNVNITLPLKEKLSLLEIRSDDIFPFADLLSDKI